MTNDGLNNTSFPFSEICQSIEHIKSPSCFYQRLRDVLFFVTTMNAPVFKIKQHFSVVALVAVVEKASMVIMWMSLSKSCKYYFECVTIDNFTFVNIVRASIFSVSSSCLFILSLFFFCLLLLQSFPQSLITSPLWDDKWENLLYVCINVYCFFFFCQPSSFRFHEIFLTKSVLSNVMNLNVRILCGLISHIIVIIYAST